jgi:hypothetical protein
VLSRLGMHPDTTPEIHQRVNRIFYAVLSNRELVDFMLEHFSTFEAPEALREANDSALNKALERGEIEHSVELDLAVADHFFRQPDALRRLYGITLHDLNDRELLQERHSDEEIDDYVDRLVESIGQRLPIRVLPELERWDENYGVGTGYGVGEVEVGPVATVPAVVEVVLPVTVVIPVAVFGEAVKAESVQRAVSGDSQAVRMIATAAALFRLAGDVLIHAEEFER